MPRCACAFRPHDFDIAELVSTVPLSLFGVLFALGVPGDDAEEDGEASLSPPFVPPAASIASPSEHVVQRRLTVREQPHPTPAAVREPPHCGDIIVREPRPPRACSRQGHSTHWFIVA